MGWIERTVVGFGLALVVAVYGCTEDSTSSSTSSSSSGGSSGGSSGATSSSGSTSSDSGPSDSSTTDTGADTGPTITCNDTPDAGTNPQCGTVGNCGQFVTLGFDAADLPAGTSATLPTGTYVLTALTAHKVSVPNIQIKITARFAADNTFQRIQSVTINGTPDDIDDRVSGTYAVNAGSVTITEDCPSADTDDPATFTVSGNTVKFFVPSASQGAGAGVVETYTVIP